MKNWCCFGTSFLASDHVIRKVGKCTPNKYCDVISVSEYIHPKKNNPLVFILCNNKDVSIFVDRGCIGNNSVNKYYFTLK